MVLVKDVTDCETSAVRGLDQQLIDEVNAIVPNALVSIEDLDVAATGSSVWALVQLVAKEALQRAITERGTTLSVNSAYRSIAAQLILFQHAQAGRCGITIAAIPGRSNHQSGLALDVEDAEGWQPFLERHGWQRLLPDDPVHFDYLGGGTQDIRGPAVLAFQRVWNRNNPNDPITEDGLYGPQTETRLGNSPAEGWGNVPTVPPRLLRLTEPFMQGDDVRQAQEALIRMGFSLTADGIYGPITEGAVRQFQTDKGLTVDGIVGPQTRAALLEVNPNPTPDPTPTDINQAGLLLVEEFEGYAEELGDGTDRVRAYLDPGGTLTIGFGHTGSDVTEGLIITREQAEQLLRGDLQEAEDAVGSLVTAPLNENQFSALVSFVFNLGAGELESSTLLELLNQSRYPEAADEFPRFNTVDGEPVEGLTRRREAERQLFLTPPAA